MVSHTKDTNFVPEQLSNDNISSSVMKLFSKILSSNPFSGWYGSRCYTELIWTT